MHRVALCDRGNILNTVFIMDGTGEHHLFLMRFLEQELPDKELVFLFCGVSCREEKIKNDARAKIIKNFFRPERSVKKLLKDSQQIILVGLFDPRLIMYFMLNKSLLHKTSVAFHGGEFYSLRNKLSWKMQLLQKARKLIVSKMSACYTFTPDDYKFAQRYYNLPKRHGYVELPWHYDVLPSIAAESKPNDPYIIMVGHNAHPEGHQIEALKQLARFKNENIKIIAPLSYGPRENKEAIIEYGSKIFGSKFVPLTTWIEPDEYQKLLKTVTVFVMGIDRQAGTFNINLMLRLGSKIYARTDTSVWSYYTGYCECEMFDIESLKEVSFSKFVQFSQQQRLSNSGKMKNKLTPSSCLETWKNVMDE